MTNASTSKGWDMSGTNVELIKEAQRRVDPHRVMTHVEEMAFALGFEAAQAERDAVQSGRVASATTCNVCYSEIPLKNASSPAAATADHFATAHPDIEVFQGARCSMAGAITDPPTDAAECVGMSDAHRLEIAIGYAPITASFPGGRGGLTHMAVIDRDRIVRDVIAAGFRFMPESAEAAK